MADRRYQFITSQREYLAEVFPLADGEEDARARVEALAIDTNDGLMATGPTS
jgi:hypothetical protein